MPFKRIFFYLVSFLLSFNLSAQSFSNEFLSIGIGAKAQGMGNSIIASVDDVTAGYWNPAGLARLDHDGWQFAAMHAEWFAGVGKFDYLSGTINVGNKNRRLGLSLIRFGIDGIPNTLNLFEEDGTINYDNVVPFSAADYALIASMGQNLLEDNDQWTVGGNLKLIYRNIGPFARAFGFGLDAGIQYQTDKWNLGLAVKDLTGTFNAWNFTFTDEEINVLSLTENEIPENSIEVTKPQAILGAGRFFPLKGEFELYAELNLEATIDGKRNTLISSSAISVAPTLGFELNYNKFIFARLGFSNIQQDTDLGSNPFWTLDPSIGIGLGFKRLTIDYAFTDVGEQRNSTFSHVISLKYSMDRKPKNPKGIM